MREEIVSWTRAVAMDGFEVTEFYIHSKAEPRESVDSVHLGFERRRTALRMAPIFLPDQMEDSMKMGKIISGAGRMIDSSLVILS